MGHAAWLTGCDKLRWPVAAVRRVAVAATSPAGGIRAMSHRTWRHNSTDERLSNSTVEPCTFVRRPQLQASLRHTFDEPL